MQLWNWTHATRGELHVANGAMGDAGAGIADLFRFAFGNPAAMSEDCICVKSTGFGEHLDRSRTFVFLDGVNFGSCFRAMRMEWNVVLLGDAGRLRVRFSAGRPGLVRRGAVGDEWIVNCGFDARFNLLQFWIEFAFRSTKVNHSFAAPATQSRGPATVGDDRVLHPIHVQIAGDAVHDRLEVSKVGAGLHFGFAHFLFGRPDAVLQPWFQEHVVAVASQEAHGNMGVEIDEARQNNLAGTVYGMVCFRCLASNLRNFTVLHVEVALNDLTSVVLGYDGGVADGN